MKNHARACPASWNPAIWHPLFVLHREAILEKRLTYERVADAAIALYMTACTLARSDNAFERNIGTDLDREAPNLWLRMAARRVDQAIRDL